MKCKESPPNSNGKKQTSLLDWLSNSDSKKKQPATESLSSSLKDPNPSPPAKLNTTQTQNISPNLKLGALNLFAQSKAGKATSPPLASSPVQQASAAAATVRQSSAASLQSPSSVSKKNQPRSNQQPVATSNKEAPYSKLADSLNSSPRKLASVAYATTRSPLSSLKNSKRLRTKDDEVSAMPPPRKIPCPGRQQDTVVIGGSIHGRRGHVALARENRALPPPPQDRVAVASSTRHPPQVIVLDARRPISNNLKSRKAPPKIKTGLGTLEFPLEIGTSSCEPSPANGDDERFVDLTQSFERAHKQESSAVAATTEQPESQQVPSKPDPITPNPQTKPLVYKASVLPKYPVGSALANADAAQKHGTAVQTETTTIAKPIHITTSKPTPKAAQSTNTPIYSKALEEGDSCAVLKKPKKGERDAFGRLVMDKWQPGIVEKVTAMANKPRHETNKVRVLVATGERLTVTWTRDARSKVQRLITLSAAEYGAEHVEMNPSICFTPAPQDLNIGDAVVAWFQCGQGDELGSSFPGRVASVEGDRCTIAYNDGDWEENVPYTKTEPCVVLTRFSKGWEEPQWMEGMKIVSRPSRKTEKREATIHRAEPRGSVWLKYEGQEKLEKCSYQAVVQCIMNEARDKANGYFSWKDTPQSKNPRATNDSSFRLSLESNTIDTTSVETPPAKTSSIRRKRNVQSTADEHGPPVKREMKKSKRASNRSSKTNIQDSLHGHAEEASKEVPTTHNLSPDSLASFDPAELVGAKLDRKRPTRRRGKAQTSTAIAWVSRSQQAESCSDTTSDASDSDFSSPGVRKKRQKQTRQRYSRAISKRKASISTNSTSTDSSAKEAKVKRESVDRKSVARVDEAKELVQPEGGAIPRKGQSKRSTAATNNQVKKKCSPGGERATPDSIECCPESDDDEAFKWAWPDEQSDTTPDTAESRPRERPEITITFATSLERFWKSSECHVAADLMSHAISHHGLAANQNLKQATETILLKGPQAGQSNKIAFPDCQRMDLLNEVIEDVNFSWYDFWEQMSSDLYTVTGDDRRMNKFAVQRIATSAHAKAITARKFLEKAKASYPCAPISWLREIRNDAKGSRAALQNALATVGSLWISYSHFCFGTDWTIDDVLPDTRIFVQRNVRKLLQDLGKIVSYAGQIYGVEERQSPNALAYFLSERIETKMQDFTVPDELRGDLSMEVYKKQTLLRIVLDMDRKVIPGVRPLVASQLNLAAEYNMIFA